MATLWILDPLGLTTPIDLTIAVRLSPRSPCVAISMWDLNDDVNRPHVAMAWASVALSPPVCLFSMVKCLHSLSDRLNRAPVLLARSRRR